jgi:4-hydroxyphenylacetate 3-monooxygenase
MRRGSEYIAALKDRRNVFIDGERVSDVTVHPAFREAVRSVAHLYDVASDPANRELMTFTSPKTGEPVNRCFMIPRSKDDLTARRKALWHWAEQSFGFMGRTPDHVAGFFAGFAGAPSVFARGPRHLYENAVRFHEKIRDEDLYVAYTIVPPQIDRSKPAHQQADPTLYAGVTREVDGGIIIKGGQMLGTGAALADYIHLSCIIPLRPGDENYALSCVVPLNAPGVKVYSRRSYAEAAPSIFDYPLASRFDETDSLLVYDDVFVPWEHVFVYRDIDLTRAHFFETAAHAFGNNQAQIRFAVKLKFLAGIARRVAEMNGSDKLPPVQGMLGEIAAIAATVEGLVLAQEAHAVIDADGVARPGAQELYANMTAQSRIYQELLQLMRELCGGGLIQLPSSVDDFRNPEIRADLERYVTSPGTDAEGRTKLLKLAWDAIGSEFAGRHAQYEMFYAGAPFIVKTHMYRSYDFAGASKLVDAALNGYDLDGRRSPATSMATTISAPGDVLQRLREATSP